jgi:ribonuclease J
MTKIIIHRGTNEIGGNAIEIKIIIQSMWKGYLDKSKQFKNYKDSIIHLHTSGHAYIKDLQNFVNYIKPKNIIPIHTEYKENFSKLFNSNVIELDDGEDLNI